MKQPRFSIHDAFEEENDEAIRVYGSTVTTNISKPSCSGSGNSDTVVSSNKDGNECDPRFVFCYELLLLLDFTNIFTIIRNNKFSADDTTSRDSDSLIQEYINVPPSDLYTHCWNHPKIRENWRTVLAAVTLLIIGIVLVTMGMISIASPANGSRGFVFLLAGRLLFNLLQRLSIFHTLCFIFFPIILCILDLIRIGIHTLLRAGSICFIPGAYHVVYIWLAAIGYRGYNFYHLPLFT